jgi:chemotaxis methyl-accepting protein methylase
MLILSDIQAALKSLSSPKLALSLLEECLDVLSELACLNEFTVFRSRENFSSFAKRILRSLLDKHQQTVTWS